MVHFNEIPQGQQRAGQLIGSTSLNLGQRPAVKLTDDQKQALLKFAREHMNTGEAQHQSGASVLQNLNMQAQIKLNDIKAQKKLSPAEYQEYKEIQSKANSKSYDADAIRAWNEKHPDLKIVSQYTDLIYSQEK